MMKLPELAVKNYHLTIMVIILFLAYGAFSILNMPRSEDPAIESPGASIIIIYPGADPAAMEQLIIDPIEAAINELEDIENIYGFCSDGFGSIDIEFTYGADLDDKYSEVLRKLNSIRSDLPEDIYRIETFQHEISSVNILQLALVSESAEYRDMKKEFEQLQDELERIPGVREVEILACPDEEVKVALDFEKMFRMNIPLLQMAAAVRNSNANIPAGDLNIGNRRFSVHTSGSYESIEEIKNTVISADDGKIAYLKDVADVSFGYEDLTYYARYNKQRAIFLTVNQKTGTNIFTIMERLKKSIDSFEKELPDAMKLFYVFDQSKSVKKHINNFTGNLLQGIVLVGIVVFLGIGFRSSAIVMLTIPMSIIISIGLVHLSGFSLEQMSITGLVISLGLLVDNAIVVVENINRFIKKGYSRSDAAIQGTAEIGIAVVSATATTVLAFVPIIMMRHETGEFIRSMPTTAVYTLLVSLILALTFAPFLGSRILKKNNSEKEIHGGKLLNTFIERVYNNVLVYALLKPKRVVALSLLIFISSLFLFPFIGVSFFPKVEKAMFMINIYAPQGVSLDKTDRIVQEVEDVLSRINDIDHFAANIGKGNPRIFYNVFSEYESSNYAQIFVELKQYEEKKLSRLISDLRKKFEDHPDANISVRELEHGPGSNAPVFVRIIGKNRDALRELALKVEHIIKNTPGAVDVYNPLSTAKTDLKVSINRGKAGILGLNIADIDRTIRTAIAGLTVSRYRNPDGEEFDIVFRLPGGNKSKIEDFEKIYLTSAIGMQIPLKQVSDIELKTSPFIIQHYNLERYTSVSADVLKGYSVDMTTRDIIHALDALEWPAGYRYYIAGEHEHREESFGGMTRAIIIAAIAIFAVLVIQFRSFIQPVIIFASIPLAVIGSILALFMTKNTFSFSAFVGLTSLVGIVVNNAIILVDYTNKLKHEGKEITTAIQEASKIRFTPIILTTATTVCGLLPLTLKGGAMWAPMGWTIIGGLLTSTLLTLIVVPVLYRLFTRR